METHKYILKRSAVLLVLIFSILIFSSFIKPFLNGQTYISSMMEQEITIIITKNTGLQELENIKKKMKDKGFEFNYSNVVYNKKEEIISISISYRDANNNSGKYSVSSENPINDILINSKGNQISIKSKGSGNQSFINQGNSNKISEDNRISQKGHREAMETRRDEMEKRMATHMQEMKERRAQMRTRMENGRESIFGDEGKNASQGFSGNYNIITKNTTEADLLKLEEIYKVENIRFSYNQLERNSSNLITHISITVNNGKGSVSTSSFGNGKDPIKDISIGVDAEHTVMKNLE